MRLIYQHGAGLIDRGKIPFSERGIGRFSEVDKLFQKIEPRPWPLRNRRNHFRGAFRRVSNLRKASCFSSAQNFASVGMG